MKVKRFVIVKGYKIVELEEKINILKKEIIRKNSRIDFVEELAYFLHTVNLSLSDVMKSGKGFYTDNDIFDWLKSENTP